MQSALAGTGMLFGNFPGPWSHQWIWFWCAPGLCWLTTHLWQNARPISMKPGSSSAASHCSDGSLLRSAVEFGQTAKRGRPDRAGNYPSNGWSAVRDDACRPIPAGRECPVSGGLVENRRNACACRGETDAGPAWKPMKLALIGFCIAASGLGVAFLVDYGPQDMPLSFAIFTFIAAGVGTSFVGIVKGWRAQFSAADETIVERRAARARDASRPEIQALEPREAVDDKHQRR